MGASFGSANGVRPNNLLLYQTPAIRGWQAGLGYSFNTGFTALYVDGSTSKLQPGTQFFGTNTNMRMLTAGVNYNQGPLLFFVAYDAVYSASEVIDASGLTQTNTNKTTPKAWMSGASFDFKLAKVSAAIGQTRDGMFFGQGAGAGGYTSPLTTFSDGANVLFAQGVRSLQYALGASIPTSNNTKVLLSWQGLQPKGSLNAVDQLATQNIYSVAYVHELSKRTDVYVWGSYGNNYQTFNTAKSSVIGTGIRHIF
jgi:predicted porin